MNIPYLVSIQIGKPKIVQDNTVSQQGNGSWSTGFYKEPVEGMIWLSSIGLSGDGHANTKNHGGHEKAILAYSMDHYSFWSHMLVNSTLPYGAFGENFTIQGLSEKIVCIGDIYSVGEVLVQVSQPRQPCWKISRRWGIEDLADKVKSTGRTGWYLRVIKEGYVERGLAFTLTDRPFPQWTIALAHNIMQSRYNDRHTAEKLASCPLLSESWRETLSSATDKVANV